jgi:6-pyruvoyltetrahydropterin/6-carboxytetrahydropterin synthase
MPQLRLTRRYRFSASHRLHTPLLDEARNFEVYGKCNNPYGHGHDYLLEVTIAGEPDAASGRLLPLRDLDEFVERVILKAAGHRNLNTEMAEFATLVPTSENLAAVVAARLAEAWPVTFAAQPARLEMVRIHETKRNIFEVRVCPEERIAPAKLDEPQVKS